MAEVSVSMLYDASRDPIIANLLSRNPRVQKSPYSDLKIRVAVKVKVKVKVQVYSLVSSAKRHSPDFTQLPPGCRTCSFISHLKSRGAYRPAAIFGARNYSSTQAFTVLSGTHSLLGRESARVSKVPCLGAHRRSIFSPAGDRTRDLSLVRRARYHWATTPHLYVLLQKSPGQHHPASQLS